MDSSQPQIKIDFFLNDFFRGISKGPDPGLFCPKTMEVWHTSNDRTDYPFLPLLSEDRKSVV